MNWSNVKLVLGREIRDQLRDRRTLFMIAVLPLLLYPLLGMSFFQISQFMREQPTTVLVVGAKGLTDVEPPLIDNNRFDERLFTDPKRVGLLEIHFQTDEPRGGASAEEVDPQAEAHATVQAGKYDAALYFPPDFADRLAAVRRAVAERSERSGRGGSEADRFDVPSPEIIYTTATEKSQLTFARLSHLVERWREAITRENLVAVGMPVAATRPFDLESADVANETAYRGAAIWSKILPVMLLLWALTGAFYPAIDLCAGEKERGTLETLLSSPAERSEIVVGKLITVMLFSMATALLNLVAIGITGWLLLSQMQGVGAPPLLAVAWLLIALVPVSALFSALCLALAAFARSTKEGQYYLMPLLLVTMPLAILPMTPSVELNLGNSLIPVTGVVLLLRAALEGNFWQAVQFLPPVLFVTTAGCLVAVRWAIDQFNSESVLFHESERFDVGLWMRHLMQDRRPTPTVAAAVFCGVTILIVEFFMNFALAHESNFAIRAVFTQLAVVATPALLMTVMFTSSPRETLLLKAPRLLTLPAALLLALFLHPAVNALQVAVLKLYPVSDEVAKALEQALKNGPSLPVLLLVIALLPAICEELAFRGFILSGMRHSGRKWRAIVVTAVFFGLTHTILQQSIIASLVGAVIGYMAVQTGSLLPCVIFHFCHNALGLLSSRITPGLLDSVPLLQAMLKVDPEGGHVYRTPVVAAGAIGAAVVLYYFSRLPYVRSREEELQEAIAQGAEPDEEAWVAQAERLEALAKEEEVASWPAPGSKA